MKYYKIGMAMFGAKSLDTINKSKTHNCKSVICQSHSILMRKQETISLEFCKNSKNFPCLKIWEIVRILTKRK